MKGKNDINYGHDESEVFRLYDKSSSNTGYQKKSLSFFGNSGVKGSVVFKRIYGYCFATAFESMQIKASLDSITITYPINHRIHNEHFTDLFDGKPPLHFSSAGQNAPNNSFLKLKFTRCGAKKFLFLECNAYEDIYNYDLANLLATFAKQDVKIKNFSQFKEVVLKVRDEEERLNVDALHVNLRHLITHDDFDYDGVSVENLLEAVSSFNINCLKRFEELISHKNEKDRVPACELGQILAKIVLNYKIVPYQQYKAALSRLDSIERNEIYQNDPLIQLSLVDIRKTIATLSTRALNAGRGIEVNEQQLSFILQELFLHEGTKPEERVWFPVGTVERLSQQLEAFFSLYKYTPESLGGTKDDVSCPY
ncbi:hypothetical protein [Legionella maioricensis]|uniref:Uncharacterized protein n=1 Tax=Legionella maioricensis TaxID=2896528 RepID=A0A9X2D3M0_9GAMM|nr:hypothetical protein [Legionella maioricensis]MCL9685816.1 hypothetical protein [Legionella maioricensis]MCL9688999.1 hypothetical protein [Legionella maioricensis]